MKGSKLTKISTLHYIKLIYRSLLLVIGIIFYVITVTSGAKITLNMFKFSAEAIILILVWLVYIIEMILRFFPSKLESMGCQKQFKQNYKATGNADIKNVSWKRTALVAVVWLALNAIFGALYYLEIFDTGILLLISLAYGVCDMICILFFCPFHTWFLRNRCCTDCRIYNWDFAMMFTPFVFILGHWFTATLFSLSIALLLRWEITYKIHPEYFSTNTNQCLDCKNCPEKLCSHKKQLKNYIKKNKERLFK